MKYIAKQKDANKFKIIEDVSKFKKEDFDKFELYAMTEIDSEQHVDIIRRQKIDELKEQLKELGVDLPPTIPQVIQPYIGQEFVESALTQADFFGEESTDGRLSNIVNPKTGEKYTMEELNVIFEKFKANIEKDIPEISWSSVDVNGITLFVVEKVSTLPNMLPNGVPIIQKAA